MLAEKVRRLLQGKGQHHASTGSHRGATVIAGLRMVPTGCESVAMRISTNGKRRRVVKDQHRVVLPTMTPGMVVKTAPQYLEGIVKDGILPQTRKCHVIKRGSVMGVANNSQDDKFMPVLACSSVGKRTCERCPWMAAGSTLSAHTKSEALRQAVDKALLLAGNADTDKRVAKLSVEFLEPFSVPIALHRQEELNLHYDHVKAQWSFGARGADSAHATQHCVLATLEQKRLVPLLAKWSESLPSSTRHTLRGAIITQPNYQHSSVPSGVQQHLCVTVVMEKDEQQWGPQSPLCGPSHPPEILSAQEQGLVECIMAAAPLLQHIDVFVRFSGGGADMLYPRVKRLDEEEISTCVCSTKRMVSIVCESISFSFSPIDVFSLHAHVQPFPRHSGVFEWRHGGALDATCSLALSLLCESESESSTQTSSIGLFTSPASGGAFSLLEKALDDVVIQLTSNSDDAVKETPMFSHLPLSHGQTTDITPTERALMLGVLANGMEDAQQLCAILKTLGNNTHGPCSVRLVLLECCSDLKMSSMAAALTCIHSQFYQVMGEAEAPRLRLDAIRCGVVDVDPLNAMCVACAVVELSER